MSKIFALTSSTGRLLVLLSNQKQLYCQPKLSRIYWTQSGWISTRSKSFLVLAIAQPETRYIGQGHGQTYRDREDERCTWRWVAPIRPQPLDGLTEPCLQTELLQSLRWLGLGCGFKLRLFKGSDRPSSPLNSASPLPYQITRGGPVSLTGILKGTICRRITCRQSVTGTTNINQTLILNENPLAVTSYYKSTANLSATPNLSTPSPKHRRLCDALLAITACDWSKANPRDNMTFPGLSWVENVLNSLF